MSKVWDFGVSKGDRPTATHNGTLQFVVNHRDSENIHSTNKEIWNRSVNRRFVPVCLSVFGRFFVYFDSEFRIPIPTHLFRSK